MSGELNKTDIALEALMDGGDPELAIEQYEAKLEESPSILASMTTPSEEAIEEPAQDESAQDATSEEPSETDESETESIEVSESNSGETELSESNNESRIIEVKAGGRKLNVDLNDEEKIQKYVKMAMGARKWQAERDDANQKVASQLEELTELRDFESTIQNGWETDGVRGVVSTLAGSEEKFEEFMEAEYQRRRAKEDANPAELELIETREKLDKERRQRELFETKQKELLETAEQDRVNTEKAKYQNMMNPAFNKWRMAGKLGDQNLEADMDSLIWEKAKASLKSLPEHVDLTPRVVEREFRKASTALRKVVDKETNTKVKQVMTKKKAAAQSKAAIAATRGLPQNNDLETKAREALKGSNSTMDAFTKFFS